MDWRTKLLNPTPQARQDYRSLATPVYRGSTVVFDDQAAVTDDWRQAKNGYSYGLYGTPTALELASRIAGLEGATETFIVPGGQAAIALIYLLMIVLAFLSACFFYYLAAELVIQYKTTT